MQLDKTEIVIRERTTLELLDLSLVVVRRYWWPLLTASALIGLPLLALNLLMISWMLGDQGRMAAEDLGDPETSMQQRFLLHLVALWYLEYPLASLPATILIGNQIFFQRLSFRHLMVKLRPVIWRAVLVLGLLRAGLVGLGLELLVDRNVPFEPTIELFALILACCGWATLRRMSNPFAPEILGLETCKLMPRSKNELSYWRRCQNLHGLIAGDCVGRFFMSVLVVSSMVLMLYSIVFVSDFVGLRRTNSQFFNAMLSNQILIPLTFSIAMWLGGVFATVFRFLSYLDARIRLEGWEVELQMKAERGRLLQTLDPPPSRIVEAIVP